MRLDGCRRCFVEIVNGLWLLVGWTALWIEGAGGDKRRPMSGAMPGPCAWLLGDADGCRHSQVSRPQPPSPHPAVPFFLQTQSYSSPQGITFDWSEPVMVIHVSSSAWSQSRCVTQADELNERRGGGLSDETQQLWSWPLVPSLPFFECRFLQMPSWGSGASLGHCSREMTTQQYLWLRRPKWIRSLGHRLTLLGSLAWLN